MTRRLRITVLEDGVCHKTAEDLDKLDTILVTFHHCKNLLGRKLFKGGNIILAQGSRNIVHHNWKTWEMEGVAAWTVKTSSHLGRSGRKERKMPTLKWLSPSCLFI